jgi:uncharacterized membrane protein YeaQ/YmgE (transglycosylase-associated protein family)
MSFLMIMSLLMMVITAAMVGWMAQRWKGRTAAGWAVLALILIVAVWLFVYFAVAIGNPKRYDQDETWYALALIASCIGGILMIIVVATLSERK